jgi:hypothetical protein
MLDTRRFAVGISRNPLKFKCAFSWVIISTIRNLSLVYMLDGGAEPEHT